MTLTQGAELQANQPASAARRAIIRAWPELDNPAAWLVALILVIMPLIANGFFLIEIFGTTLILGVVALSLMFLAGYGGMVSLMQLTIAGFAGYMVAVFSVSGNANISLGWPWWLATPMALTLATLFGTLGGALAGSGSWLSSTVWRAVTATELADPVTMGAGASWFATYAA